MGKISIRVAVANFLGIIFGLLFAFFLIAAPLFADGGDLNERMFSFFLVFLIYGSISLGLALLSRTSRAFLALCIPAVLISISLFYMDGPYDLERNALFLIYPTVAVISSIIPFFSIKIFSARKLKTERIDNDG